MIQIRAHRTDDGIYVFDSQAQPKGAQHVYWWSLRANEMRTFTLDASFFSGMYLVRNKEALFQAAEKYRLWSQKYLDAFTTEWTAYWSSRNRPPPVSRASAYYADTDGRDYSDSSEEYDGFDIPGNYDGYGDTGEGGWDYDDT